jgi:hypothetical protein
MTLTLRIKGDGIDRLQKAIRVLGDKKARLAYRMAVNQAGRDTKVATSRALSAQTGLKKKTTTKALKETKASASTLEYRLEGKGGDISLKHFSPRETRKGVSANPWGRREVGAGTFMKAGWFPKRVTKSNWNGQVFSRAGGKTEKMDRFSKEKSGLFIPVEMVKGATAKTFEDVGLKKLDEKVLYQIKRATKGMIS